MMKLKSRQPDDFLTLDHPLGLKMFTIGEINGVQYGVNGLKTMIPARCYYDEEVYQFEVDHILKKNWLIIGRWDELEKPGDYFTRKMFGESILFVRDKDMVLHAFLNVCQHRWAQLMDEGQGNTKLLMCPYHSWTYNLDGTLRGVAVADIPGFDKKSCKLNELRLEIWQGYIFINFDPDAQPLAEQLAGLTPLIERFGTSEFRMAGEVNYDTQWNYKFSFETGYEAYHHEGVHRGTLTGTSTNYMPYKFGTLWGSYGGANQNIGAKLPYGEPPWFQDSGDGREWGAGPLAVGIYPNAVMVFMPHATMAIATEHMGVTENRARTIMAIAPWAKERDAEQVQRDIDRMTFVQSEDSAGCRMLQGGVSSKYNTHSVVHPLEAQLSHYYSWFADQYVKASE